MELKLLHIFRNTLFGREVLLGSSYFCKKLGVAPVIYIPEHLKFLMYFENDVVQVDLDKSFVMAPETAKGHSMEIVRSQGLAEPNYIVPKQFTASTLPDIPVNFNFMCCPRSITDISSKIGLGYIGPKVRRIVQSAKFPVLIASSIYKEWNSITVMFGGSMNAVKALRLGLRLRELSGLPVDVFTQERKKDRKYYENKIDKAGLLNEMEKKIRKWYVFNKGEFSENLYHVPHDSLIVIGAYGHGIIKDIIFGSTMEKVQTIMPNNLLIVGPNYSVEMR